MGMAASPQGNVDTLLHLAAATPVRNPLAEIGSLTAVDFDAGALFSGQPSGRKIKGYAAPCRHTPAIDPD
jgi:hypothetical protein